MMNQMVSMVGPMAHSGHALQTGKEMDGGMGLAMKGGAFSDGMKPSLGRTTGTNSENATSHAIAQAAMFACPMHPEVRSDKAGKCPKCGMNLMMPVAPSMTARGVGGRVPGYPQDMWMTMDDEVARPETSWLPVGWTGSMMGMMTLVRVLPPDKYDRMMALIKEGKHEPGKELGKPTATHQHG